MMSLLTRRCMLSMARRRKKGFQAQVFHQLCKGLTTSCRAAASIKVEPEFTLLDEKLKTVVWDLHPEQKVTLHLNVTNRSNLNFSSCTHFKASPNGVLDLDEAIPCLHPCYDHPDPMGIFWTMKPKEDSDSRFWSHDARSPFYCRFRIFEGHISDSDAVSGSLQPLAEQSVQRIIMANGVKRIPVKEGRIRGTLFLPPGEGPFPAVIKLYGGIHKGQVIEDKAALMASRGFVTLSLAFFGVDDLPKSYVTQPLELDYFEEAVDYMLSLEKTKKNSGLGVVAMSKGGEIALSMAAHFPPGKVAAVVAINSFITVCVTDAVYKGQVVQKGYQFYMGEDAVVQKGPNLVNLVGVCRDMAVRGVHAVIPFWNSEVNILLQAVEDDQCCDSQQSVSALEAIRK